MASLYPPGPPDVPADLLAPTSAYKRHAYLAIGALLGFVVAYLSFTGWLVWMAIHGVQQAFGHRSIHVGLLLFSAMAGLLAAFLIKSLLFVKRSAQPDALEVTAEEEPQLFEFLHQLAAEAKAPRPHRVFLSHEVNASVFYDLSLLNFIWPSKKNLALGLGLVNALTLSELKAVLAHELGHFAQRTTAIGRWVYIAMQVTHQLVSRRDAFDEALVGLTRLDLRVAWIGWLMQLLVWATRSLIDTASLGVVATHRALGREMELQADLVAAALSGSDAMAHALYKLPPAGQAIDHALSHMAKEANQDRAIDDVLAVQSRVLEHLRQILCDPMHGKVPPVPADGSAASHRVFSAQLAYPPKMWATHPPSDEREENVKRRYLRAELDDRSAWILFRDPAALRAKVTYNLYVEGKRPKETASLEECLARLDASFSEPFYDPSYRGAFLGRSPVRAAEESAHLYGEAPPPHQLPEELAALYPESLRALIEQRNQLLDEQSMLRAVQRGVLKTSTGKRLLYRSRQHKLRELPHLLAQTERELEETEAQLAAHDRRCRTAHLAAARHLGERWPGWEAHLRGALALLHYADHRERDLDDAVQSMNNALSVALADGKVSDRERRHVLAAAEETFDALRVIHQQADEVVMGPAVAERYARAQRGATTSATTDATTDAKGAPASWAEILGELTLPSPTLAQGQLGDWLTAIHSWTGSASLELMRLRRAALAVLLEGERAVAQAAAAGQADGPPRPAPSPPPAPPALYRAFLSKHERPLQTKLGWWDRFATADGWFGASLRFTISALIVGAAAWLGVTLNRSAEQDDQPQDRAYQRAWSGDDAPAPVRESTITAYNGLERDVSINVGGERRTLRSGEAVRLSVRALGQVELSAETAEGQAIEAFSAQLEARQGYVYNVAHAAPIEVWNSARGREVPDLTGRRWTPVNARWQFTPPVALGQAAPDGQLAGIYAPTDLDANLARAYTADTPNGRLALAKMAESHARWDGLDSPRLFGWLQLLAAMDGVQFDEVIAELLRRAPDDLMLRTLELQGAVGPRAAELCAKVRAAAEAQRDPDEVFLAALCQAPAEREEQLLAAATRWPDHPWLGVYAGRALAKRGRWAEAAPLLEKVRHRLPAMGIPLLLARLRRLTAAAGSEPDLSDLFDDAPLLPFLLHRAEAVGVSEDLRHFYDALAAGDWRTAERLAVANGDDELLWKLVTSRGAYGDAAQALPELAAQQLARPPSSRSTIAAAALYGLALRLRRGEAEALREHATATAPELGKFLDELGRGKARPDSPGDKDLRTADVSLQAMGYLAAAEALGDQCPAKWRRLAERFLLPAERPAI